MKKTLLTLLFGISSIIFPQSIGDEFQYTHHLNYFKQAEMIDIDKNGSFDVCSVGYDFNFDGEIDMTAVYKIEKVIGFKPLLHENAFALAVDTDYDGKVDYMLIDTDGDGKFDKELDGEFKPKKREFRT